MQEKSPEFGAIDMAGNYRAIPRNNVWANDFIASS